MLYFDHDTSASTDPKIMQLRLEFGGAAVDAYWYLIEQMHRDERGICIADARAMRVHCHTLCTDEKTLREWVDFMLDMGLMALSEEEGVLLSERAMKNVGKYQGKKEKASSAAKSRWSNADAMQTHGECSKNAMPRKEKKRNSSNTIKSITTTIAEPVAAAAKAAPNSAEQHPHCPMCEVKVWKNTQTGKYDCLNCFEAWSSEAVVMR